MKKEADSYGYIMIPKENKVIYEEALALKRKRENTSTDNINTLLKSEDKKYNFKSVKTDDIDFFDGIDIASTLKNTSTAVERKLFSKIVASSMVSW